MHEKKGVILTLISVGVGELRLRVGGRVLYIIIQVCASTFLSNEH